MHSKTLGGHELRYLLLFLSLVLQQIHWWLSSIACLIADSLELSQRPLFILCLPELFKDRLVPPTTGLFRTIHIHSLVSSSFVDCCARYSFLVLTLYRD
ncbi:hypothetical protein F5Y11DRAFT_94004 [Daldinia sp. FL1419]|nr:hypothetical protein F5Y11DRAFT_94004 [Daldinia sp. FL1419]